MRTRARQGGFTLIEIVVAFLLLSLVLMTSFEIFTGGMRRASDLEDYSRALLIAHSRLSAAGTEEQFKDGEAQGESDDRRYRWTTIIRRTDEGAPAPGQPNNNPYQLFRVDVSVSWAGADARERSLTLSTMGLGPRT